jgi:hypothetical protein
MKPVTTPGLSSLALFSMLALGCASSATSVPVKGPESDLATLVGEWKGHYENDGAGRSGEITFKLEVGRHSAEGQVVMQLPTGEARPLKIQFVEIARRELRGRIDPYVDPTCDCTVQTEFVGLMRGSTVAGTFTSRLEGRGGARTGTWAVQRVSN